VMYAIRNNAKKYAAMVINTEKGDIKLRITNYESLIF